MSKTGKLTGKTRRRAEEARRRRHALGLGVGAGAVAVAGVALLLANVLSSDTATAAPSWRASTTDGEALSSRSLKGDVYALDFFFLTCGICERQLPDNRKLVQALADREDFHFISVTADPADTVPLIEKHRVEEQATWPHVRDEYGLYQKFQVRGNPNIVFVDRDGNTASVITQLVSAQYLIDEATYLLDGDSAGAEEAPQPPETGGEHPPGHG